MYKIVIGLLLTFSLTAVAQQKEYKTLSVDEFKSKVESTKDAVLLDLRTDDEVKKGVIPRSTQLDYFRLDFEDQVKKLDKNKSYFLYCAVGGRSGETLELMKSLGFPRVYHLKEGIEGWKKKKYTIVIPK